MHEVGRAFSTAEYRVRGLAAGATTVSPAVTHMWLLLVGGELLEGREKSLYITKFPSLSNLPRYLDSGYRIDIENGQCQEGIEMVKKDTYLLICIYPQLPSTPFVVSFAQNTEKAKGVNDEMSERHLRAFRNTCQRRSTRRCRRHGLPSVPSRGLRAHRGPNTALERSE
ncbi:Gdnf Family Receptor Alpha-Like [Manis pentadactyla]|nr:Gdnf Family Receptor Alpha-Like [Manis pentadactyla]